MKRLSTFFLLVLTWSLLSASTTSNVFEWNDIYQYDVNDWGLEGDAVRANGFINPNTGSAVLHLPQQLSNFSIKYKVNLSGREGDNKKAPGLYSTGASATLVSAIHSSATQLMCYAGKVDYFSAKQYVDVIDADYGVNMFASKQDLAEDVWREVVLYVDCNTKRLTSYIDGKLWEDNYSFVSSGNTVDMIRFEVPFKDVEIYSFYDATEQRDTLLFNDYEGMDDFFISEDSLLKLDPLYYGMEGVLSSVAESSIKTADIVDQFMMKKGYIVNYINKGGKGALAVTDTLPYSSGKALFLNNFAPGSGNAQMQYRLDNQKVSAKRVVVEFDSWMMGPAGFNKGSQRLLHFEYSQEGGNKRLEPQYDQNNLRVGPSQWESHLFPYLGWSHVVFTMDSVSGTYSLGLNGNYGQANETSGQGRNITLPSFSEGPFSYKEVRRIRTDYPIDNFLVYTVSEIAESSDWQDLVDQVEDDFTKRHLQDTLNAIYHTARLRQTLANERLIASFYGVLDGSVIPQDAPEEEIPPLPVAETGQRGGYTDMWDAYPAGTFNPRSIVFDTTGVRRLRRAPEVGIHPRIFFGPEEVPNIAHRMKYTKSGKAAMAQMRAHSILTIMGGTNYSHSASYAQDASGNRLIDNIGYFDRSVLYARLVAQMDDAFAIETGDLEKAKIILIESMLMEAYICMVHDADEVDPIINQTYAQRSANLAKAMTQWAKIALNDADHPLSSSQYRRVGGEHMALCYDLHYNNMSKDQQDMVRLAISKVVSTKPIYGSDLIYYACKSNWVGLNTFELIINLSIEGEEGYNEQLTVDYMKTYRNFISNGWYESGAPYEGLGKNYQFNSMMVAAARRGYSLFGHPHVRNYAKKFIPAIMQPFGFAYTGTDVWGGSGYDAKYGGYKFNRNDMPALKYMYPEDKAVDFAWRNYIGAWNFKGGPDQYLFQQYLPNGAYHAQAFYLALFGTDYDEVDWETRSAEVYKDENLNFFAKERGLAVMRSASGKDAMWVHYHCRQNMGGHTSGDRNNFALSALGRIWMPYTYSNHNQNTKFHSCILINDKGVELNPRDGVKARQMAKVTHYEDTEGMTQIVGDATFAYSYEIHWEPQPAGAENSRLGHDGWEKMTETINDFQYAPVDEEEHNIPMYDYAHWSMPNYYERLVKRPFNMMEKVYRTMTMMRGDHPYILIADEVKKNDEVQNYKWVGQMAKDLVLESTVVNIEDGDYKADLILKEPGSDLRLLVRVLQDNGYDGEAAPIRFEEYNAQDISASLRSEILKRLVIESNCVSPDFKVLMYPYKVGDPLPITQWNANKSCVKISIGDQLHYLKFPLDKPDIKVEIANASDFTANQLSDDAKLVSMTISEGNLFPPFTPNRESYRVTLPKSITSFDINCVAQSRAASIVGDGLFTNVPDTAFITVEAQDGTTTKTYAIAVHQMSDDATLKSLTVSRGVMMSSFDPEKFIYVVNMVPGDVDTVVIAAELSDDRATLEGNVGKVAVSDTATLKVTSQDGVTVNVYTIVFKKIVSGLSGVKMQANAYPNPFNNTLFVSLSGEIVSGEISICDMSGKCVYSTKTLQKLMQIDMSPLSKGVYVVSFETADKMWVKAIVKN